MEDHLQKVITENGSSKVRLEFEETDETAQIRENLRIINRAVSSQWYDLEIENEEMADVHETTVTEAFRKCFPSRAEMIGRSTLKQLLGRINAACQTVCKQQARN